MSTKKRSLKQPVPAHAPGAKVYILHYQGRDGGILQAEVEASEVKRAPITSPESGKITGTKTIIWYDLKTAYGPFRRPEDDLIRTFPEIAKTFAQRFLTLLK
jgi:hypothetical protein